MTHAHLMRIISTAEFTYWVAFYEEEAQEMKDKLKG